MYSKKRKVLANQNKTVSKRRESCQKKKVRAEAPLEITPSIPNLHALSNRHRREASKIRIAPYKISYLTALLTLQVNRRQAQAFHRLSSVNDIQTKLSRSICAHCSHKGLKLLTSSTQQNLSPKFHDKVKLLVPSSRLSITQRPLMSFARSSAVTKHSRKFSEDLRLCNYDLPLIREITHETRNSLFNSPSPFQSLSYDVVGQRKHFTRSFSTQGIYKLKHALLKVAFRRIQETKHRYRYADISDSFDIVLIE